MPCKTSSTVEASGSEQEEKRDTPVVAQADAGVRRADGRHVLGTGEIIGMPQNLGGAYDWR